MVTRYSILTTKQCAYLDLGLAGIEVYDILRDDYDIQIEFGDLGNILAYLSIGDRVQDLERLVSALLRYEDYLRRTLRECFPRIYRTGCSS